MSRQLTPLAIVLGLAEYALVQAQSLDTQLLLLLGKFDTAPLVTTVHARLAVARPSRPGTLGTLIEWIARAGL